MENDNNLSSLELTTSNNQKVCENNRLSLELTISNNYMEAYFSNLFEDIRHERSIILLLSLTDPNKLKQSKFTDDEINNIKSPAPEKLHRQKSLKECFALQLLD